MTTWLKNHWEQRFLNKIYISLLMYLIFNFFLLMFCIGIGAILYAWFTFPKVTINNWLTSIITYSVFINSLLVSFILTIIFIGIYFYFHFEKWNPKHSKFKKEMKLQIQEFKKINKNKLIFLNKNVGLIKSKLNQHTLLIGATGNGKTTTALSIIKQLSNNLNQPVIIIDGKGDTDLIDKIKNIDEEAFIWTISGKSEYNPFSSNNYVILADKIMSLFDFTEPHYQAKAHSYLLILIKTITKHNIEMNLENIMKYFAIDNLKKLIEKKDNTYQYLLSFSQDEINGLLSRLSVYKEQLGTSIGIDNELLTLTRKHKIILFSLNSLTYPQLASNMGKLLIQDLKEFASIKPKELAINLVLDEFNVFATETIINLINKTRSFNFQCFLCFQTINDLKTKNKNLTDSIFGNTANIIAHNLKDPNSAEYIAKVFGTKTSEKTTKSYDKKNEASNKGSIREVEEYIVHPNELKRLQIGQAYCKIILENSTSFIDKIIVEKT